MQIINGVAKIECTVSYADGNRQSNNWSGLCLLYFVPEAEDICSGIL